MVLFMADGGGGTMPREDFDFIRKQEDLLGDALDQGTMIPAGKVGAADAFAEQHVAGDQLGR